MQNAGIHEAHFEADQILSPVLSLSRAQLHMHPEYEVSEDHISRILVLSDRRAGEEPLAYLLGNALFCGLSLQVNRNTLIPRTETECLVSIADEQMETLGENGILADWCTGSGCIAIALLLNHPGWRAFAVDSSAEALAVAAENARLHGVADRLRLIRCSEPAQAASVISSESLDLVVFNPPYIVSGDIPDLEKQVREFEPASALDGGGDGLDVYRLLFSQLPRFMKNGAPLLLETGGKEQIGEICDKLPDCTRFFDFGGCFDDHRGFPRFMLWRK